MKQSNIECSHTISCPWFTPLCLILKEIPRLSKAASETAKRGKAVSPSCLRWLVNIMKAFMAARNGNPDALRCALDQNEPGDWDGIMCEAVRYGSLDCVRVLYDKGYEQHRSPELFCHPVFFALQWGQVEILWFRAGRQLPLSSGCACASVR
jgi:hypothetical protein